MPITYPRKCEHCDYVSNNPSMYSYHKRTHQPVPAGTMCDHGCGQLAICANTNGKFVCNAVAQRCPAYIKKHSARVKEHWQRPDSNKRKEATRQSLIDRLHNEVTYKKMSETKRAKFGILTVEDAKNYRHYARYIRERAQKWAREQGYTLGRQTYHVDHKLSILDAWHAGLSDEIVNHPANLQIIEAKKNTSKGATSYFTVEDLLAEIKLFEPR